jgi:hypothetical protein
MEAEETARMAIKRPAPGFNGDLSTGREGD